MWRIILCNQIYHSFWFGLWMIFLGDPGLPWSLCWLVVSLHGGLAVGNDAVGTGVCTYLSKVLLSVAWLCIHSGVSGLCGSSTFHFLRTILLFSMVAEPFYNPANIVQGVPFSKSLPTLGIFSLLIVSHPKGCQIILNIKCVRILKNVSEGHCSNFTYSVTAIRRIEPSMRTCSWKTFVSSK